MLSHFKKTNFDVYLFSCIASIILTIFMLHHRHVFDSDGIIYLYSARSFAHAGMHAAYVTYSWPFYSILIGATSKLANLSILHSAYLLNIIFSALTVLMFILIISELTHDRKILIISSVIILCFLFNSFLADILRDHGYWFFYFVSLYSLIKYSKNFNWYYSVIFILSLIFAILFRSEGILILLFAPLAIFFWQNLSWKQKLFLYFKFNFILLLLLFLILFGTFYLHKNINCIFKVPHVYNEFFYGISLSYTSIKQQIITLNIHITQNISVTDSGWFFLFGMIGYYIFRIFSGFSLAYTILFLYSLAKKNFFQLANSNKILWIYIIINTALTFFFFSQNLFLELRYITPLILTFLIYTPFAFFNLYEKFKATLKHKKNFYTYLFLFICLLMLAGVIGNLHYFGSNKNYIYNAAVWLNKHTNKNTTIYANDERIYWLSNRLQSLPMKPPQDDEKFSFAKIYRQPWRGYDYFVVEVEHDRIEPFVSVMQKFGLKPTKIFIGNGNAHDAVLIFKLR